MENIAKYKQALEDFSPTLPLEKEVQNHIKSILSENYKIEEKKKYLKFIHSTIDLTSLDVLDNEESILRLCHMVNDFDYEEYEMNNIAALCVYPNFIQLVAENLTDPNVKIASVAGAFPSGQSFLEVKVAETALAVNDGAQEIDIVLNLGKFFSGNYEDICLEIEEIKASASDCTLKLIIETTLLKSFMNIQKACILGLFSGADFIKTSTGKNGDGASYEAVYIIAHTLKAYYEKYKIKKGIKISGGVRTSCDAINYFLIIREVLGQEWLNPELFRIGSTHLVKDILKELNE